MGKNGVIRNISFLYFVYKSKNLKKFHKVLNISVSYAIKSSYLAFVF